MKSTLLKNLLFSGLMLVGAGVSQAAEVPDCSDAASYYFGRYTLTAKRSDLRDEQLFSLVEAFSRQQVLFAPLYPYIYPDFVSISLRPRQNPVPESAAARTRLLREMETLLEQVAKKFPRLEIECEHQIIRHPSVTGSSQGRAR